MDHFRDPYNPGWGDHSNFRWIEPDQQYQRPPPPLGGVHTYRLPNHREFPSQVQLHNLGQHQPIPPPRPPKSLEEMMEDLITSRQLVQRNLMANYNAMHELEHAQRVQGIDLDQLSRQIAQLATPISNTREGGGIPAQEQLPKEKTLSRMISGAHYPI